MICTAMIFTTDSTIDSLTCDFISYLTGNGLITHFLQGSFSTVTDRMTLFFHSDDSVERSGFVMIIDAAGHGSTYPVNQKRIYND